MTNFVCITEDQAKALEIIGVKAEVSYAIPRAVYAAFSNLSSPASPFARPVQTELELAPIEAPVAVVAPAPTPIAVKKKNKKCPNRSKIFRCFKLNHDSKVSSTSLRPNSRTGKALDILREHYPHSIYVNRRFAEDMLVTRMGISLHQANSVVYYLVKLGAVEAMYANEQVAV
jgi:hypothetical protein